MLHLLPQAGAIGKTLTARPCDRRRRQVKYMKSVMLVCAALLGAMMGSVPAVAQVVPVPAGEASARAASEDKAAQGLPQRSPLWMAVEAEYRQRGAERSVDDRRLTAAQRQELREQIRRGSGELPGAAVSPVTDARPAR